MKHYDIYFQDEFKSDRKGFNYTLKYCKDYIKMYNGTNESYFSDYKTGIVQIVCLETEEVVFETEVL